VGFSYGLPIREITSRSFERPRHPRRRYFWLLVVGVAGYVFGYQDAFRGPDSLGWKFGALVDRVTPASITDARRKNADALRQRTQGAMDLPQ
jgi:hypothetical protein